LHEIGLVMRYYFHLETETNVYIDHLGKEFEGVEAAKAHAVVVARELSAYDKWLGWMVRVIDADNAEVCCVPIVDPAVAR
jgi:hypothetical protein